MSAVKSHGLPKVTKLVIMKVRVEPKNYDSKVCSINHYAAFFFFNFYKGVYSLVREEARIFTIVDKGENIVLNG